MICINLADRHQSTCIHAAQSEEVAVDTGVPQGSVLDPHRWLGRGRHRQLGQRRPIEAIDVVCMCVLRCDLHICVAVSAAICVCVFWCSLHTIHII